MNSISMRKWRRRSTTILAVAWIAALPIGVAQAQGRIGTCVRVAVPPDQDAAGFAKLVRSEVDRHSTHYAVEQDCPSHLVVEVFPVGAERYMTGRLDGGVPYRVRVQGAGVAPLEPALEEVLTVVLNNDPVRLRGPGQENWLTGWLGSMRRRGLTIWGVQFQETGVLAGGRVHFVPALGLMIAREAGPWQVGVGCSAGWNLDGPQAGLRLVSQIRMEAQLAYFVSEPADTSPYLMGMFGVLHQRFDGPVDGGASSRDEGSAAGAGAGVRLGMEMLRTTNTRLNVFVEGLAPLFAATSDEQDVVRGWTPVFGGGAGVVF